jgi:hypothetical protein
MIKNLVITITLIAFSITVGETAVKSKEHGDKIKKIEIKPQPSDPPMDSLQIRDKIIIKRTPYKKKVKVADNKEIEVAGEIKNLIFPNKKEIELGCKEKIVEKKHPLLQKKRKLREQTISSASVSNDGKYVLLQKTHLDYIIAENESEENRDALPGSPGSVALLDTNGNQLWEFNLPYGFEPGNSRISDSNNIVAVLIVCPQLSWSPPADEPVAKLLVLDMEGNMLWSYPSSKKDAEDFTGAGGLILSPNGKYIAVDAGSRINTFFIDTEKEQVYKHQRCAVSQISDNGIAKIRWI